MSVCAEKNEASGPDRSKVCSGISEQVLYDHSMSEGREGAGRQKIPEPQKCVLACYWEQG